MNFPWNFPGIFRNFPQNLLEIFTFHNSYEFHSQHFSILRKNFINNYYIYIYKIYPTMSTDQNCRSSYTNECRKIRVSSSDKNCIITFWCISRKPLAHSDWIPNSRILSNRSSPSTLYMARNWDWQQGDSPCDCLSRFSGPISCSLSSSPNDHEWIVKMFPCDKGLQTTSWKYYSISETRTHASCSKNQQNCVNCIFVNDTWSNSTNIIIWIYATIEEHDAPFIDHLLRYHFTIYFL